MLQFEHVVNAFDDLEAILCIPDLNSMECICEVCDKDIWKEDHDQRCELSILRQKIYEFRDRQTI